MAKRREHGVPEDEEVKPPGSLHHVSQIWPESRVRRQCANPFSEDKQAGAAQARPHGEHRLPVRVLEVNFLGSRSARLYIMQTVLRYNASS